MKDIRKVAFLDCTSTVYNGHSAEGQALGGIERTIVGLSSALGRAGFQVSVYNRTTAPCTHDGVSWRPFPGSETEQADAVIACNDVRLFDIYARETGKTDFLPLLWMHNRMPLEKIIRKGRLWPLCRWRPLGVFLSQFQERETSRLLPFRQRLIAGHGLDFKFLDRNRSGDRLHECRAFYISQAYRGLADVITLWIAHIHPVLPQAALHVFCGTPSVAELGGLDPQELARYGIHLEGKVCHDTLIERMKKGRAVLIPGHRDETFCLAATEAISLGLPVVTYGTGALTERVTHGKTGMIARSPEDFAGSVLALLGNDEEWQSFHESCLTDSGLKSWDEAARPWIEVFQRQT